MNKLFVFLGLSPAAFPPEPALAKCLSAGMRLDADPRGLRAALADALYQRLRNPARSMPNVPERQH